MKEWSNWAGNQRFTCQDIHRAASLDEIVGAVEHAASEGRSLRVAGSGHSFTPVVETSGTVLDISGYAGLVSVDVASSTARFRAGTQLGVAGALLWDAGFSIVNQGDLDRQTLAGAVATGTKGSGVEFGTMSSQVSALGVVTSDATLRELNATTPEDLLAGQVSLGMLGVVHEIELAVLPRYYLREANEILHVDELLDRWDTLVRTLRHFSFWWMPTDRSAAVYELPEVPADHAFAKTLREEDAPEELTVIGEPGNRLGRSHLVYPDLDLPTKPAYELEYVVPAGDGRDAFLQLRDLMRSRHPDQTSPVQIRWQRADHAYLSPQYERDSVSVSVSGIPGTTWEPFLRDVDALLSRFEARPHWGKVHFLTAERVRTLYPKLDDFLSVRERIDPAGMFLSRPLRELFGLPGNR